MMTKREKIVEIVHTLIVEGLADPLRILVDAHYAAAAVTQYIEAANIARSMLHMPPIDLDSYPD